MKYRKLEFGTYVFFVLLGGLIFAVTRSMGREGDFPAVISIAMIVTSAACFALRLRAAEDIIDLTGMNLKMVLITAAVIAAYILLIEHIGYLIASTLLAMSVMRLLGYRRLLISAGVAASAAGLCFVVFRILLAVPLPVVFLNV